MKKKFNVTGTCIPKMHYMVDTSNKINTIITLVENEEYLPIKISFEGIGDSIFEGNFNRQ